MTYRLFQSPFTFKFRDMSKQMLKDYFQWFMQAIPDRINELSKAIHETRGFDLWKPDFSPASSEVLGEWFANQIEIRRRTRGELDEIRARSSFPIEISDDELTDRSFSIAVDIGMYLSQVLLQNHRSLRWDQPLSNKKFVDFGQPVLVGFGPVPLNPVRIVVTLAYGLASKQRTAQGLRQLYEIWSKKVSPA
jgi:hypothetical protein